MDSLIDAMNSASVSVGSFQQEIDFKNRLRKYVAHCCRFNLVRGPGNEPAVYYTTLKHIAFCGKEACDVPYCEFIKDGIRQLRICTEDEDEYEYRCPKEVHCDTCILVVVLLCRHVLQCDDDSCSVPFCCDVKPNFREFDAGPVV